MNIVIVTQARTGSTRFPNKILKKINNKSLLEIHLERILQSKLASQVIVATTDKNEDDIIELEVSNKGISVYRGSENDVLDRFYQAVKSLKPDYIVRLTSDCPLIDPKLIDDIINTAINKNIDYCSNVLIESFPDGQDIEVFTFNALETAWEEAKLNSDREHVTPYIRNNSSFHGMKKFDSYNYLSSDLKYKDVRMTVDEPKDLEVVKNLINFLGVNKSWKEYADLYFNNSDINNLNKTITRNEGYYKSLKENKNE